MYELLGLTEVNMVIYWCLYGLLTGCLLMIALYLLITPRPVFAPANITASLTIRRSAGAVILVSALEYVVVMPFVLWVQSLLPDIPFGSVTEWGKSVCQQLFVLIFLPFLSWFLHSVLQGITRFKVAHILLACIFPAFLLIWTIVYGIIHIPEEGMQFSTNLLIIARFYWTLYVVVLLYYYVKALHRYRFRVHEMYSNICYRSVRWLYVLAGMNVIYFAWFAVVYVYDFPLIWGVLIQHVLALMVSLFACYHADRQELIIWDKEDCERPVFDINHPVAQDLDKKMNKLIKQQIFLNMDLTRDDLVDLLQTNRTYLNMYFASKNQTFYGFINTLRVEYAISLLKNKQHPCSVKEAALSSGFRSAEVFSRQFKIIKGYSPRQFVDEDHKHKATNK